MRTRVLLLCLLALAAPARASDPPHSVARRWNELLLDLIRLDRPAPTIHSRNLFHVSAAMWDAWSAYAPGLVGYYLDEEATAPDVEAARAKAMSFAVYRVLAFRFVEPKASAGAAALAATALPALMDALGYDETYTATSGEVDPPAELGNRIGAAIVALGLTDGSNEGGSPPYSDPTYAPANPPMVVDVPGVLQATEPGEPAPELPDPNRWQPLSLDFLVLQNGIVIGAATQSFLGSGWGAVTPFALTRADPGDVYRDPGPPPTLGCVGGPPCVPDAELEADVVEVIRRSGQLDPDDGATIDISPGAWGNNPLGTNDGVGYPVNPATGLPYAPNVVKRADFFRVLAEFWADGPSSETPPGHWNTLANYVGDHPLTVKRVAGAGDAVGDLEWDVKLYFALNAAVYDAAIACWDAKRAYDSSRPITLVRYMGGKGQSSDPEGLAYHPDGLPLVPGLIEIVTAESSAPGARHANVLRPIPNTAPTEFEPAIGEIAIRTWPGQPDDPDTEYGGVAWIRAIEWLPYMAETFVTPPFAGYYSGHSTFSRAAAEVLVRFTGDGYFPGGLGTFTAPQDSFLHIERGPSETIELQWARYYDASDQASISRVRGGIHISADDFAGRINGAAIGGAAYALAETYFAPEPDTSLLGVAAGILIARLARRGALPKRIGRSSGQVPSSPRSSMRQPSTGVVVAAVLLALAGRSGAAVDVGSGLIGLDVLDGDTPADKVDKVETSADGRFVYAVDWDIVTYARDVTTGRLAFVARSSTPDIGNAAVLSHDGAHLYVSAWFSGIHVFAIDPDTGVPAYVDTTPPDDAPFPVAFAVSADGKFLYAGSEDGLVAFERDFSTGTLGPPFDVAQYGAIDVAISPDGAHVYALGHAGPSRPALNIYARDDVTGALALLDSVVPGETGVEGFGLDIDVSPDGRDVYVADSLQLAVFARDPASGLLSLDDSAEIRASINAVAAGDGFAWVLQYGSNGDDAGLSVKAFSRSEGPDGLSLLDGVWTQSAEPALGDLIEIAVAAGSWDAYFGGIESARFWSATIAPTSDLLEEIQSLERPELDDARFALVTPDGRHIVIGAAAPSGLAVFARDASTGTVELVEVETELLGEVADAAPSPDGRYLYAADRNAGVVRFARDAETGALEAIDITGVGLFVGARSVVLSADGARLYAGGYEDIAVYARDATSGALTQVETVVGGASHLTLSGDERFLYADRHDDPEFNTTSVYSIDPIDGSPHAAAPLGPRATVVSRDGAHLYQVREWSDDSCQYPFPTSCPDVLRTLEIDAATGRPAATPLSATREAPLVASGDVTALALSRDGRFLYLSRREPSDGLSALRSCLVAFSRERADGQLRYADAECAPVSTFAIAPRGENIYTVDAAAGTLRVYAPEPVIGALAMGAIGALAALSRRRFGAA